MKQSIWFVSSTLFWGLPPEKWFTLAKENGLQGLEIWTQQLVSQGISPDQIYRLAKENGLKLTAHSYSWDMNLISLSKPMQRAAMKLTRRGIDMAARMGASQITIHPGREGLPLPDVNFDQMQAESALLIGRYGKKMGVPVSFEVMEKIPKERFTSAEAMKRVEKYVSGDVCWGYTEDVAHCDSETEIFSMAQELKDRLLEFHVSNKKGTVRHVADVRGGDFQLPDVTRRLAAYGLPMPLEGYDPSGRAERFENTWKWLMESSSC